MCVCVCLADMLCSLGGDVAVNSGSTAQVVEPDLKAGAAMFNVVDNLLLPPDELSSVSHIDAGCSTYDPEFPYQCCFAGRLVGGSLPHGAGHPPAQQQWAAAAAACQPMHRQHVPFLTCSNLVLTFCAPACLWLLFLQLNLKQAQAVKFLTTIEEATGYDESLSTMYRLIQDSDSGLANVLADKTTVATVFAPVDDVSQFRV